MDVDDDAPDKRIRAFVVRRLLTQNTEDHPAQAVMRIGKARIVGPLDLSELQLETSIRFTRCTFDYPINLEDSQVTALRLPGCVLPGVEATNLCTSSDVELNDGFVSAGRINMTSAEIGGVLRLTRSRISGGFERDEDDKAAARLEAVVLSRARIAGGLFARYAVLSGQLRLISCRIGGTLSLKDASIYAGKDRAVHAQRCHVEESVLLQRAKFWGRVHFMNATIGGGIDAARAIFDAPNDVCDRSGVPRLGRRLRQSLYRDIRTLPGRQRQLLPLGTGVDLGNLARRHHSAERSRTQELSKRRRASRARTLNLIALTALLPQVLRRSVAVRTATVASGTCRGLRSANH